MQLDLDYMKGLLSAFEASRKAVTSLSELEDRGIALTDKLAHHLEMLVDRGLVSGVGGGIGVQYDPDGTARFSAVNLRLTADGHFFLDAIRRESVWTTVKANAQAASLAVVQQVASLALDAVLRRQIEG